MRRSDIRILRSFVWPIAGLLRGDFTPSACGKAIHPFAVPRRLVGIREEIRFAVLDRAGPVPNDERDEARDALLIGVAGQSMEFHNLSGSSQWSDGGRDLSASDFQGSRSFEGRMPRWHSETETGERAPDRGPWPIGAM